MGIYIILKVYETIIDMYIMYNLVHIDAHGTLVYSLDKCPALCYTDDS